MARSSLCLLGVTVATPACLFTSPDFSDHRTRPEIINTGDCQASPTLAKIYEFTKSGLNYQRQEFAACVLSDDAQQKVKSVLLLDYGQQDPSGEPYQRAQPGPELDAAQLSDGPRRVAIPWAPNAAISSDQGCHTLTLLLTHEFTTQFGRYYCPTDPKDASTLTWFINVCESSTSCGLTDCPLFGQDTNTYCEGVPP